MITISDLKYIENMQSEDYFRLPHWSYSGLKYDGAEPFSPTQKMQLGTDVHKYILEPHNYDGKNYGEVSKIGQELIKVLPMQYLKFELVVTCKMHHEGITMDYKGKIDAFFSARTKVVVDLKVTEMPIQKGIEFFRYDRQLSGYCIATGADKWVIISYNRKTKQVEMKSGQVDQKFWMKKINEKGEVLITK